MTSRKTERPEGKEARRRRLGRRRALSLFPSPSLLFLHLNTFKRELEDDDVAKERRTSHPTSLAAEERGRKQRGERGTILVGPARPHLDPL